MAMDPKEKWENRRKNWKSRTHLHEKRERNLEQFAVADQPAHVVEEPPEPEIKPVKVQAAETAPAERPKKDGDIAVGIVVNGKLVFFELHWKGMAGSVMPTKLNQGGLREMFCKALSTLGRIE